MNQQLSAEAMLSALSPENRQKFRERLLELEVGYLELKVVREGYQSFVDFVERPAENYLVELHTSQQPPAALNLDRWRATSGNVYWYNSSTGSTEWRREHRSAVDDEYYRHGNYYRSQQAAEQAQARHSALDWIYEMTEQYAVKVYDACVTVGCRVEYSVSLRFPSMEIRDAVQRRAEELGHIAALKGGAE